MKKVFGYIFIVISIILAFAIIGQFQKLIASIIRFIKVLSFNYDSYETAYAIGSLAIWIFHFLLVIVLWDSGRKWTRKPIVPK